MSFLDQSEFVDMVMPALARALGDVTDVTRSETADAGTYTYRYATLSAVLDSVRAACAGHGLVVSTPLSTDPAAGVIYVGVLVIHAETGQWVSFPPLGLRMGSTPQQTGSAISYGRRYVLMAVFGIAAEDDDGRAGSDPHQSPYRSEAEARIHGLFAAADPALGYDVRQRFRELFGVGLSALPVGRHDEALEFVREALQPQEAPA